MLLRPESAARLWRWKWHIFDVTGCL